MLKFFSVLSLFILIISPTSSTGYLSERLNNSIPNNSVMTIKILVPEEGQISWIDVAPPSIVVKGYINTSNTLKKVLINNSIEEVEIGNRTAFLYDMPVRPGKNIITVTAIDSLGNIAVESRNISINLGLPPPALITIFGKVVDSEGSPVFNASLLFESSLGLNGKPFSENVATQKDGAYTVTNVWGYKQKVIVQKEGYKSLTKEIIFENRTNELNFVLTPDKKTIPGFKLIFGIIVLIAGFFLLKYRVKLLKVYQA